MNTCTYGGCTHLHYAKGLCSAHYQRKRRGGDMDAPAQVRGDDQARFWGKVDRSEGCWEWTGSKTSNGYGRFRLDGRLHLAHRASWKWTNGPIPDGMQIDHTCWSRSCVNPSHLRLANNAMNSQNRAGGYGASGARGVHWNKNRRKWQAGVMLSGKGHYLGLYEDMAEAERAVTEWRREHMPYSIMDQERKGAV